MKQIKKYLHISVLCLSSSSFALEEAPWLGQYLEFDIAPKYSYSFFNRVNHAPKGSNHHNQTQIVSLSSGCVFSETWHLEAELECADVTSISWGYRSFALQGRKLWFDDVAGDPISLTTGISYRDASSRMRRALSTPYHAQANFELETAIGREWSRGSYWVVRSFGLAAIGQGSHGYPWSRFDYYLMWNLEDRYEVRLYEKSYLGFGHRKEVDIEDFHGWSKIAHRSIDLGISLMGRLGLYGTLQFDANYRVYARSYPEAQLLFLVRYQLPFSIF